MTAPDVRQSIFCFMEKLLNSTKKGALVVLNREKIFTGV